MRYELYIDIFFLTNFLLDYLLLYIVKRMLKCTATHGNILLASIVGAGLSSVIVCIPMKNVWRHLILHSVVNTVMLKIIVGKRKNVYLKAWVLLYLVGFLMGGVLEFTGQYFSKYYRSTTMFLFIVLCSYEIVWKAMELLEMFFKTSLRTCRVTIICGSTAVEVSAIIDTGNMLYDPITKKPVHIISDKTIKKFTLDNAMIRYIPYHTVQNNCSVMPLIKMDKIRVHGKQEVEITSPLLGISERTDFGDGEYDMILNPKDL